VAHNACLGDRVIVVNGALVAGHAVVEDSVFISGNCLVHQFVRIGTLALMRGGAAISQDLPPFMVAHEDNTLCGLNTIGLRRAGFSAAERLELKRLYHKLFLAGQNLSQAAAEARKEFTSASASRVLDFIVASKRGVLRHRGPARGEIDPTID
jgi:UDP-N-acetylglucosamine acyltransferase